MAAAVQGSDVEYLRDVYKTVKVSCNLCLREHCFKESNKFNTLGFVRARHILPRLDPWDLDREEGFY